MDLFTSEEITGLVPGITPGWAQLVTASANAEAVEAAPCLSVDDTAKIAQAKLIVARAVRRALRGKDWVRSETTGPYSVDYTSLPVAVLSDADRTRLRALCTGATDVAPGMPRGEFPDPVDYDRLFAGPRQVRRWT